ncbi:MAG: lipase family protein [Acidimicrobiia bacterium]
MAFDAQLALTTVQLSRIAYHPLAQVEHDLGMLVLGGSRPFSGASTQAFLAEDEQRRFLVFRGTESTNATDWIRDAEFRPVPGVFGTKVHSGFRRALDEVWDDVVPLASQTDRKLVLTGHSLGAGLAVLAAARLAESGIPVADVYTYGGPRNGLAPFAAAYNSRLGSSTYRVINSIDIVTRVPLLVQGYRHVGRRMYFAPSGDFHPDAGAWYIARDDLRARLTHFGKIGAAGVLEHEITRYVERVKTIPA